jgi:exonuclease III
MTTTTITTIIINNKITRFNECCLLLTFNINYLIPQTQNNRRDAKKKRDVTRELLALNDSINQMDLTDVYRPFHPKTKECTFFSEPHGTYSKINHTLRHKASLYRYKKFEIKSHIPSDHH